MRAARLFALIATTNYPESAPARRRWRGAAFGLALAGALLRAAASQAQAAPDSVTDPARLLLRVAVPPLAYRTYEAALEYRTGRYASVLLAPRLSTGPVPAWVSDVAHAEGDRVRGYGGTVAARLYLPDARFGAFPLAGCYLSVRAEYQHLQLNYFRDAWGEDLGPDGLRYYVLRPRPFGETIWRAGGAVLVGYQLPVVYRRLRFDTSLAFNQFYSHSSIGDATRYDSSATDYASQSPFLSLDVSLGFVLK